MNKHAVIILSIIGVMFLAQQNTNTTDLQASIVFALISAALARRAIHKVDAPTVAMALVVALALFASYPTKSLLDLSSYPSEVALAVIYAATLWCLGLGWKRSWRS